MSVTGTSEARNAWADQSSLQVLSETALRLLDFPSSGDLHQLIADCLIEILDSSAVVVSEYDRAMDALVCRAFSGKPDTLPEIVDMLGVNPVGTLFPVTDSCAREILESGCLTMLDGGVYQAVFCQFPQELCGAVDTLLKPERIHAMGFVREGALLGSMVFSYGPGEVNSRLVETFGRQAGIALHRKRVEDERNRLCDQLHQSQKMESIGRMAGGIAHDFNNLLTTILGNATVALEDLREGHAAHEPVAEIVESAGRAAELTQQLLAFSRRRIVEPEDLVFDDVVESNARILKRLAGEDIELHFDLQSGPDGVVCGDPVQLGQVLINLAVNARDAMPEGGFLCVSTERIRVNTPRFVRDGVLEPGQYVVLEVTDTGIGMAPEVSAQAFDPFFTTKPGTGTGLGLSTVFGVVRQHSGAIEMDTRAEAGTTFRIFLPCCAAGCMKTTVSTCETGACQAGNESILLVEDDLKVRRTTARMLIRLGYQVLEAADGASALKLCEDRNRSIDILLTDIVMPNLNGYKLAEQARAIRPEMRVLFTSGYSEDVVSEKGVHGQGAYFISKPYSIKDLAAKIRVSLSSV